MSFCDFAENVEDAIDQGCAYDYDEDPGKRDGPQLLWLSDIPLFQTDKAVRPGGHSYLTEEDNDTELQCTYQSSRLAYRSYTGTIAEAAADTTSGGSATTTTGWVMDKRGYYDYVNTAADDDDDERRYALY
jgi:hypothetical protein